jgi:hypothetical protein
MDMRIEPFNKIGSLDFGMKRETARVILGPKFKPFRKSPFSTNDTDDYYELGLHLYYSDSDELEFVEVTFPSMPIFEGINLLQGCFEDIIKKLQDFDKRPEVDEFSCIFHEIGVGLYSERVDKEVEAVSVFSKDYYAT